MHTYVHIQLDTCNQLCINTLHSFKHTTHYIATLHVAVELQYISTPNITQYLYISTYIQYVAYGYIYHIHIKCFLIGLIIYE